MTSERQDEMRRMFADLDPEAQAALVGDHPPVRRHFDLAHPCDGSEDCGVEHNP